MSIQTVAVIKFFVALFLIFITLTIKMPLGCLVVCYLLIFSLLMKNTSIKNNESENP